MSHGVTVLNVYVNFTPCFKFCCNIFVPCHKILKPFSTAGVTNKTAFKPWPFSKLKPTMQVVPNQHMTVHN